MGIDHESVLVYGTRIPNRSGDINQDLKEMVSYARIALAKATKIVLPEIFDHILSDYMLPVPAAELATAISLGQFPNGKRKRSKSYEGDTDDTENTNDTDSDDQDQEQEEEAYGDSDFDCFDRLKDQINDAIAHLFGPRDQTMQLSYARPYYDCEPDHFTLYFTYQLPDAVTLHTLQSMDTAQYKSICDLFNVQCHRNGPELFSLPNIW